MNIKDTFRYLVGAYYGIEEMDEYLTKEYILKDIENYIKDYLEENYDNSFNCKNEAIDVRDNVDIKVKLQDSLLVLNKINADMDLVILVKKRIKNLNL